MAELKLVKSNGYSIYVKHPVAMCTMVKICVFTCFVLFCKCREEYCFHVFMFYKLLIHVFFKVMIQTRKFFSSSHHYNHHHHHHRELLLLQLVSAIIPHLVYALSSMYYYYSMHSNLIEETLFILTIRFLPNQLHWGMFVFCFDFCLQWMLECPKYRVWNFFIEIKT